MEKEELYRKIENYLEEGFMKYTNMHLEKIEKDSIVLSLKIDDNSLNPEKYVHGGLIFALADSAMGMCAFLKSKKAVTIDANINYLKPTTGSIIYAIATPIKQGKTISHYEAKIYNEKKELTAISTSTYYYIEK